MRPNNHPLGIDNPLEGLDPSRLWQIQQDHENSATTSQPADEQSSTEWWPGHGPPAPPITTRRSTTPHFPYAQRSAPTQDDLRYLKQLTQYFDFQSNWRNLLTTIAEQKDLPEDSDLQSDYHENSSATSGYSSAEELSIIQSDDVDPTEEDGRSLYGWKIRVPTTTERPLTPTRQLAKELNDAVRRYNEYNLARITPSPLILNFGITHWLSHLPEDLKTGSSVQPNYSLDSPRLSTPSSSPRQSLIFEEEPSSARPPPASPSSSVAELISESYQPTSDSSSGSEYIPTRSQRRQDRLRRASLIAKREPQLGEPIIKQEPLSPSPLLEQSLRQLSSTPGLPLRLPSTPQPRSRSPTWEGFSSDNSRPAKRQRLSKGQRRRANRRRKQP